MKARNKITCCRDCVPPKRHEGCHSTCEDYFIEKEELENKNKEVRKQINAAEYEAVMNPKRGYMRKKK